MSELQKTITILEPDFMETEIMDKKNLKFVKNEFITLNELEDFEAWSLKEYDSYFA